MPNDLPELEPRTAHSSDLLENAELRVKWFHTQRDRFTEVGFMLALDAMEATVDQHRQTQDQVPQQTAD